MSIRGCRDYMLALLKTWVLLSLFRNQEKMTPKHNLVMLVSRSRRRTFE
jgi:hypothetical protein